MLMREVMLRLSPTDARETDEGVMGGDERLDVEGKVKTAERVDVAV